MDFNEWFESRDDIGCLIGLEGYAAEQAWNARQAEIDALKAKIDGIVNIIAEAYKSDGNSSVEIVHDEIQELLK